MFGKDKNLRTSSGKALTRFSDTMIMVFCAKQRIKKKKVEKDGKISVLFGDIKRSKKEVFGFKTFICI